MISEQREVLDECIVKIRAGRMKRRTFLERAMLLGLTGSSAISLLESCGGSSSSTGNNTVSVIWLSENDVSGAYQHIVDTYNQTNTDGIHVTWQNGPVSTDQSLNNYRAMFRTHGHATDVISLDIIYPAEFALNQWTVALDDKWPISERTKYLQGPIIGCTFNGKIWAAPFRIDAGLIYYRTDIVTTPPQSWEELTTIALQNKDKTKYGYVWQGSLYEGLVCKFVEVLHGYGGDVLDPNDPTLITINSAEALQALTRMVDWVGKISPANVTSSTEETSRLTWLAGDAIFMRNWPYAISSSSNPAQSKVADKFDIHPMLYGGNNTTGHSAVGGWQLAINAFSDPEKQDAAWKFIHYMLQHDAQKMGALIASWTVTLQSIYDDTDVLKKYPDFQKFKPIFQTALPRPISPRYTKLSSVLQKHVHDALLGVSKPADALRNLEVELQAVVAQ